MGTRPAYGWYLRHVDTATFTNCSVKAEHADGRPYIKLDDCKNVDISGLSH